MLKKIISGGQIGVDAIAVITAKKFGLETGGTMPKGFITQAGSKPEWAKEYGMKESTSYKYVPRTCDNVRDSDATIRFANDFNSAGEIATLRAIQQYKKPHLDVGINCSPVKTIEEVAIWLTKWNVETLNVAGNSEKTYTGISGEVAEFLEKLFIRLGLKEIQ